ncbi:MAG: adenylyltransferase/cytidyltransferase family protein [Dehalococcoidia bacterium]
MTIRVYVDMTADLFHYGHVNFLKNASLIGDFLIVGIHSDKVVQGYKRSPIMTMEERIAVVSAIKYVDEVIPDAPLLIDEKWIKKHDIDMIVHGDDWEISKLQNIYKIPIEMGIFKTVPHTPSISTTDIIKRLNN